MKLLIVDDCMDIVNILSSFLELSGHEISEAFNGKEAEELLKHNSYDLVITDAEMPGLNGRELCRLIKSGFPSIAVIGMSGSFDSLNELKEAGADVCFSKPFNIDEIERTIENLYPDSDIPTGTDDSCQFHHFCNEQSINKSSKSIWFKAEQNSTSVF